MKTRKESALGIHFDFHARPGMTVGDIYSPESVAAMLDRVRPDFAQCDTKGHAGLSSYPTKAGHPADRILHDPLRMWRELTAERDIALYAHHSGLYEMYAAAEHPDWAVINENGVADTEHVSVFSPYADEYLIPQLREIAGDYGCDGVWLDGECWGAGVDYSPRAREAYRKETGREAPKHDEEDYLNYVEFQRRGFKNYVSHIVEVMKREYPSFQITSNWIFSEYMPQQADVPVDFLSGDYTTVNAVNSARHHGRVLAANHLTWDLMAWGQNTFPVTWVTDNRQNKEAEQLKQEAAVIVSLGGAFEYFDILYGHGTLVQSWCIDRWGQVADFVREREKFCFQAKPVPQVGILFPETLPYRDKGAVYSMTEWTTSSANMILAFQDAGFSSSVLFDGDMDRVSEFPLIVLPDAELLSAEMITALKKYVFNGGRIIADLQSRRWFPEIITAGAPEKGQIFVDGGGSLAAMETERILVPAGDGDLRFYEENIYESSSCTAVQYVPYGDGCFCFQCFALGAAYGKNISVPFRRYLQALVQKTGFVPKVRIHGSSLVDVTLMQKNGDLCINLINMAGAHADLRTRSFDEIPPLYGLEAAVDLAKEPLSVYQEPEHLLCPVTWDGRTARISVKRLDIHSVLVVKVQ